jgi:hypothetical protein
MRTLLLFLAIAFCSYLAPLSSSAQTSGELAGKWHFVLQTEGGDRTYEATFTVDGDKVGGKWDKYDVKGTFTDGKLALEFPVNSDEAGEGILKITGKLEKDELTGTWSFQTYEGEFKATRAK